MILPLAAAAAALPVVRHIFGFPSAFVENVQILPNGVALLSTMESDGLLYAVDTTAAVPQARPIGGGLGGGGFGNATALTGMVDLGDGLLAVAGGVHTSFAFERDSMHVYVVSVTAGTVVDSVRVPGTSTLNGLAALPGRPRTLLAADSIDGRLFRIDLAARTVSVASDDRALAPSKCAQGPPIGVNGLRIRDGHVYFTNSGRGTFARYRIDADGRQAGPLEVLARSPSAGLIYDDFTFDREGNAYIAVHPSSVAKVTPDGRQTTFVGGGANSTFKEPTSAALAHDGWSIYVTTGGAFSGSPREGGKLLQVYL